MRFTLVESTKLYRGTSLATRAKNNLAGIFFATTRKEASNFGKVETSNLKDDAKIYEGINSLAFCEENNLIDKKYDFLGEIFGANSIKDMYEDNRQLFATQAVARYELEKQGYDGAHWQYEDDLIPEQYQVWNYTVLE